MSRRIATGVAWSLWALVVALLVATFAFAVLNRGTDVPGSVGGLADTLLAFALFVFPSAGAVIATRRPGNPLGWLFLAAGVLWAIAGFTREYGIYAFFTEAGSLPGAGYAAWLSSWTFMLPLFALPPLVFLLFPEGRFQSRRQRAVGGLALIGIAAAVPSVVAPGNLQEPPFEQVANPFGVEGAARAIDAAAGVGWVVLTIAIVAATALMLLRLHRARGVERQQLKWLASAGALFAIGIVVAAAGATGSSWVLEQLVLLLTYASIPVATGFAILRYRLYEIDRIVNRTVVYGVATAGLAGLYFGIVLLLQIAFDPITRGSDLAIAISTLTVAALFRPVRSRVQALIDRRFYRRRYDAERAVSGFATRLREETDLDTLATELRTLVTDTLQPVRVTLWLREERRP